MIPADDGVLHEAKMIPAVGGGGQRSAPSGRANVHTMSTLDDWIAEATRALELPPAPIPVDLRDELLDLTRDVAHGVARIAGPLTCYLVGLAVANGAAPSTAVDALKALVAAREVPAREGPAAEGGA